MGKITITELPQKVDEQLSAGLSFGPTHVPEYFVNNIVQRTLAYLLGWDKDKREPVKLKAMPDGSLCTVTSFSPITKNETRAGSAVDAWTNLSPFTDLTISVDIFIWDNAAIIGRTVDGITWQDDIEIPANTVYSFDGQTKQIRIRNKTAGLTVRYQVVGWY